MRKNILLMTALFLIIIAVPSSSNAQGAPVRLELKPFPEPEDGIMRCKPGDERQIRLVGHDADNQETSLNKFKPSATSSNQRAATAQVPTYTGHQVILRCVAEGKASITASYGSASTNLDVEVAVDKQTSGTTPQPSPSPSPSPTPAATSQSTNQSISGYEIVTNSTTWNNDPDDVIIVAQCPAGKRVLGGGATIIPPIISGRYSRASYYHVTSEPMQSNVTTGVYGWRVKIERVNTQAGYGASYTLKGYAICANIP